MRPGKAAFVTGTGAPSTVDALAIILAIPAWMGVAALAGAALPSSSRTRPAAQALLLTLPLVAVLTQAVPPSASLRAGLVGLTILATAWWRWPPNNSRAVDDGGGFDHPATARAAAAALTRRLQRAGTVLAVCAAIAAVDFQAFPRAWAKDAACKSRGLALMDTGLGLLVALDGAARLGASDAAAPPRIWADLAPCLSVGLVRALLLPAIGYHAVPHEYGAHCNAFMLLAALRWSGRWGVALPARLTGWALPPGPPDGAGLARAAGGVAAAHGAALAAGVKAWALSERSSSSSAVPTSLLSRLVSLASANKESLAAFPGLWALYAGAAALARWHAAVEDGSAASAWSPRRRLPSPATNLLAGAAGRRAVRSALAAAALAAGGAVLSTFDPPCRRCANPTYALLCLALHEATAAAVAAVVAVAVVCAGPGAAAGAFHPLATVGRAGALPALLAANLSSGLLNLGHLTDGAGPGRARLLLTAHLGLTLAVGSAAARWRAKRWGGVNGRKK